MAFAHLLLGIANIQLVKSVLNINVKNSISISKLINSIKMSNAHTLTSMLEIFSKSSSHSKGKQNSLI